MRIQFLFLLTGVLLFAACENTNSDGIQTSELGTRYSMETNNPDGQAANTGDFIYFNAVLRTEGDSILFDTRDGGGNPPVIQALSDTIVSDQIGPVEDVVRKMRVGERAIIRSSLDQFPSKPPGLENDTVLLYDIEVTEIVDQEEFTVRQQKLAEEAQAKAALIQAREEEMVDFTQQVYEDYKAGRLDGELETTPSGLRYLIHEEGDGAEAEAGKGVSVQYIGRLTSNGEIFDQSFERGQAIGFPLGAGRVIPGWDEGIDVLQEGDRATLIIPSELAYGAQGTPDGSIPGGSELMFYVELEEVQ